MSDETSPQSPIRISWLLGLAAALAFFALVGAYASRMTWTYTDYDEQRAQERLANLDKIRQAESALISKTEWVDQGKGIVRIPIEEAMAKEIDTLKAKAPEAGCAIAPPAPPPPPPAPATNSAPASATPATHAAPAQPAPPAKSKKTTP